MTDAAAAVVSGSCEGKLLTPDEVSFLKKESPVGLTIFSRNIEQENQGRLTQLVEEIQSYRQVGLPPMIVSIDQEGGRVARLKPPFMNLGPALNIEGGKTDQSAVERLKVYGQELGKSLFELGINCNFAPVLDILTEPTNIAIGDRCFGKEPSSVVIRGGAVLMGMNASGILTCIKHFPGQGNAKIDTHEGTATIDISLTLLHQRELFPFVSLHKYAPMLMVSHCKYPSLDTKPASLSKTIMTDLIRTDLKYTGVVVTDDMTMGAMPSDIKAWKESILASIAAGADLVLVCNSLEKWQLALDAIRAESSRSHVFAKRLAEAAARVTRMRQKFFR